MSIPTIDLVYQADCPNVATARANLIEALSRAGLAATWLEHRISDRQAPERVRGYGSPTILIDSRDVAGLEPEGEDCCRVYIGPDGTLGAPSVEQIMLALARMSVS